MNVSSYAGSAASMLALQTALRSPLTRAQLVRAASRRLGNDADAEDCVQEACVDAFLHVEQLREPERVRSWLTAIVVNASRMRVRAAQARRRVHVVPVDIGEMSVRDPSPAVDVRLHALRVVDDIRRRVRRHDVRDLLVVDALLDDDDGYSVLARRCAMTTTGFKTRVSRIRKRLRRALERAA